MAHTGLAQGRTPLAHKGVKPSAATSLTPVNPQRVNYIVSLLCTVYSGVTLASPERRTKLRAIIFALTDRALRSL